MNDHIGPHVPCVQRAFFVSSLIAIPVGIGTIVGGILIIVFISGQAAAASGAVLIFIGFCLTVIPPYISFKIFNLRLRLFEGRPVIAKSYGDFPDDPTRPRKSLDPRFLDISNPRAGDIAADNSFCVPVRASYMPEERVLERQTGMEEVSTSFAQNSDTPRSTENSSQKAYSQVAKPKSPLLNPAMQANDDVAHGATEVRIISGQTSTTPDPRPSGPYSRNASSLYPGQKRQ